MRLSILSLALAASAATARQFEYRSKDTGTLRRRVTPRPDDFWDHVVKGADIAGSKASSTSDETQLANFNLRASAVDPSELGVDTVKQYSGYLDNDQQDKHLFYCELCQMLAIFGVGIDRGARVL